MKTWQSIKIWIVVACLATPWLAYGEEGSKLPSLNPFSRKAKAGATSGASAPPTSGWHWPKLWPAGSTAKAKSNQPSTWQKMTTGTKNAMAKTGDALNPFDDEKKNEPAPRITGSKSAFSQASAKKSSTKKGSLLPSMPWSTPAEEKPKTVNDFLSQPRLSP